MNHLKKAKYLYSGLSHTRLDNIYKTMKSRCYTDTNNKYHRYGARGIKICDEWLNDKRTFFKWSLENGYDENLTIDRIDNDGDYCPENCRWVNNTVQANNKTTNVYVFYNGKTYTMAEFCRAFNLKYKMFHSKYRKHGMNLLEAMEVCRCTTSE